MLPPKYSHTIKGGQTLIHSQMQLRRLLHSLPQTLPFGRLHLPAMPEKRHIDMLPGAQIAQMPPLPLHTLTLLVKQHAVAQT